MERQEEGYYTATLSGRFDRSRVLAARYLDPYIPNTHQCTIHGPDSIENTCHPGQ
jgi:hypothetical protein